MSKNYKRKKRNKGHHSNDYIDNTEFSKMVTEWIENKPEDNDNPPEKIVLQFMKIANKLTTNHKFFNYDEETKKDFVQNAMLKCVKYAKNFDPSKGKTAFAYFTTIIYYSFLDSLKKLYKNKNIENELEERVNEIYNIYDKIDSIDTMEYIKKIML